MKLLFGSRDDAQSKLLSPYVDRVYYWEDCGLEWDFFVDSDATVLIDLATGERRTLGSGEQIMLRYPYESAPCDVAELCQHLFYARRAEVIGNPSPLSAVLDKVSQLRLFGVLAPSTILTNISAELAVRGESVVKSLSQSRSQVTRVSNLYKKGAVVHFPVLLQDYCEGQEYKSHFLLRSGELEHFTVRVHSREMDYRHGATRATYAAVSELPGPIQDAAQRVHEATGCSYFDIDWKQSGDNIRILEWNNSPASAYFEELLGAKTLPFSRKLFVRRQAFCFSTRDDGTLREFLAQLDNPSELRVLTYEDLGTLWTYSVADGALRLHVGDECIEPSAIYDRGLSLSRGQENHALYAWWIRALDQFAGKLLSKPSLNYRNGSKLLQMSTTLRESIGSARVGVPMSWIVKSTHSARTDFLFAGAGELIVKSCSGVRSKVVDQRCYRAWDRSALQNLPTLFQEKVEGDDVRVHVLGDRVVTVELLNKAGTDYRYADEHPRFRLLEAPSELRDFCLRAARAEGNAFVGIDFLRRGDRYDCLEVNPGPGWAYFFVNAVDGEAPLRHFAQALQHQLFRREDACDVA